MYASDHLLNDCQRRVGDTLDILLRYVSEFFFPEQQERRRSGSSIYLGVPGGSRSLQSTLSESSLSRPSFRFSALLTRLKSEDIKASAPLCSTAIPHSIFYSARKYPLENLNQSEPRPAVEEPHFFSGFIDDEKSNRE
jgi:hypothetical protein